MMVWKMIFLFNWVIFRFHVNLPGCNPTYELVGAHLVEHVEHEFLLEVEAS